MAALIFTQDLEDMLKDKHDIQPGANNVNQMSAKLYTPEGEATELKLIGVLDLVLRNQNDELIVVDHKTAARAKSQSTVDEDMQFTAYSYLLAANRYVGGISEERDSGGL